MIMHALHNKDPQQPETPETPETILIVDDEPAIRDLCEKALVEYRILQAGNCARRCKSTRRNVAA